MGELQNFTLNALYRSIVAFKKKKKREKELLMGMYLCPVLRSKLFFY